ncbi:MAG TPA: hypothetical protein ENI33_05975, partial [Thermoplasmatales archaeon]|nr:hypothetical protein [Thermoplasmatales archaeon]
MKYKLVVFDMDGTILRERTIFKLAEEMGFKDKLLKIMNQDVESYKKSVEIARLLKCTSVSRFMEIFKKIHLQENMEYVLKRLREMGIKTAIITNSYQLAANHLKDILHIDYAYSNELVIKDDHITGDIIMNNKKLTKRF